MAKETETEEEIKALYEIRDEKGMTNKVKQGMMEITRLKSPEEDFPFYKFVMENFSKGEMAHVVCTFIAKEMADKLENDPHFKMLITMLVRMENNKKENNE